MSDDPNDTDVPFALLAAYLRTHKRYPQFTERWQFGAEGDHPRFAPPTPVIEYLLHAPGADCWYVRWPNGSQRWERSESLAARGFELPDAPLLTRAMDIVDAMLLEVPGVQRLDVEGVG